MDSIKESIGSDNLDTALLGIIKVFFDQGEEKGDETVTGKKDPLQEIASILFPHKKVSRDYALRVALGYRNIWHQQINEMLYYKEPSQKFNGNALLFITKEPDEKIQKNILESCKSRYKPGFKISYISGDHLSCITNMAIIEEVYNHIISWKESL